MKEVVERVKNMERSGIRAILNIANSMDVDILHLEIGQPHYPTPQHIVNAAVEATKEGYIRYTMNEGRIETRKIVADKINNDYSGFDVNENNILLSIGAVYGLAVAILSLVEPHHKVLLPDPSWPNYKLQTIMANADPLYYPLQEKNNFRPDVKDLEKIVTKDTDMLVINNPGNPTGAVFTKKDIEELIEFAKKHDLYILSDEVYEKVIYEGKHIPIASFDKDGRVITVSSLSKTYSMTGWRIGYVVADEKLCQQFVKLSETFISCPPYISQKALEAAFLGPQDFTHEMVSYYRRNIDVGVKILSDAGISFVKPNGALYFFINISKTGMDSNAFALELLNEKHVSVGPGNTFGPSSNKFVRLSFSTEFELFKKGIERFAEFLVEKEKLRR